MNEVMQLLEMKNYWFAKFLAICENFMTDLKAHPEKFIDDLELFEKNRQSLLNILKRTEEKIQFMLNTPKLKNYSLSSEEKTKVNYFFREKDAMLNQIIKLDSEIIAAMEKIKSEDEKKIHELERGKKALSKYKSHSPASKQVDRQV